MYVVDHKGGELQEQIPWHCIKHNDQHVKVCIIAFHAVKKH